MLRMLNYAGSGLSLIPDLVIASFVDADTKEGGRSRSGAFFSARQIANRFGSAAASKVSGAVVASVVASLRACRAPSH